SLEYDEVDQQLFVGLQPGGLLVYDVSSNTPVLVRQIALSNSPAAVFEIELDHFTRNIYLVGLGGIVEVDASGTLVRQFPSSVAHAALPVSALAEDSDFDNNRRLDLTDLDQLVANMAQNPNNPVWDLTGDGRLTIDDLHAWLGDASMINLPNGQAYSSGDANLDGFVDQLDFAIWHEHKFTATAAWSAGDFNGDGFVDGSDFGIWNSNKYSGSQVLASLVPEPTLAGALILFVLGLRGHKRHMSRKRSF
ncbi:MAG TPA: dockerin type I domain-containing protein, partial [Pirellulaceae bacterium]